MTRLEEKEGRALGHKESWMCREVLELAGLYTPAIGVMPGELGQEDRALPVSWRGARARGAEVLRVPCSRPLCPSWA